MKVLTAFADIADGKLVTQYKSGDSALARLLHNYDGHAQRIDHLPNVSDTLTGRELKDAIATMDEAEQVRLAYFYYVDKGALPAENSESAAEKENRQLFHWIVKVTMTLVACLFMMGAGSVMTYLVRYRQAAETSVLISGLFSTAAELARILLSIGGQ